MKISLIITCDTRSGFNKDFTKIEEREDNALCGCISSDFLNHGILNKLKFFKGYDLETIICIDEHEPVPKETMDVLFNEQYQGLISRVIVKKHDRTKHRWNDWIYHEALSYATGDYVVKIDGDVAMFKRHDSPIVEQYLNLLDNGYNFVCQPTQILDHGMTHASTRFFICKRRTLDLDEIGKCLDDSYRNRKFPNIHMPCMEFILGTLHGPVLYPYQNNHDYIIFSWVHYFRGVMEKLNNMNYDEVYNYVFKKCGGPLGASDLIGRLI